MMFHGAMLSVIKPVHSKFKLSNPSVVFEVIQFGEEVVDAAHNVARENQTEKESDKLQQENIDLQIQLHFFEPPPQSN